MKSHKEGKAKELEYTASLASKQRSYCNDTTQKENEGTWQKRINKEKSK